MPPERRLTRKTRLGYPRNEAGERLCRLCRKPKSEWTEKRRRTWCSAECVHAFRLATSAAYLREMTRARDHGVCAVCGLDCSAIRKRVNAMKPEARRAAVDVLRENGFRTDANRWNGYRVDRSLWDADHIIALDEGGSTELDNVQTLCQPCHKEKTGEQAGRRAKQVRLIGKKWRATQEFLRLSGRAGPGVPAIRAGPGSQHKGEE